MLSVRSLSQTNNSLSCVKIPSWDGMVPVSWLSQSRTSLSWAKRPSSIGIRHERLSAQQVEGFLPVILEHSSSYWHLIITRCRRQFLVCIEISVQVAYNHVLRVVYNLG